MEANKKLQKDFKKWILFNDSLSDFKNLYSLYHSIEHMKSTGNVVFRKIDDQDETIFHIEQQSVEFVLELDGDKERKQLLAYLLKHYFPDDNVEDWYMEKLKGKEKSENHYTLGDKTNNRGISISDIKAHPKELKYYNIKMFISVTFYLAAGIMLITTFTTSISKGVLSVFFILGIVLIFTMMKRFVQGIFIGIIKGNSVRISKDQYPEIYAIVKSQSEEIGLLQIPEIYIANGSFNAFVTKLAKKKYLMLFSEVVETTLHDDFEVLKFVVGHELGHIKRKHLTKDTWLFPSMIIPFLTKAYSRGCEYTCDRLGFHFSNKGAFEGILILATGKEIYTKINIDQFVNDSGEQDSFWFWLSEKFLTHPHISKRLKGIKNYDQKGY